MAFLADNCTFCELTSKVLADCRPFSCGNDDLDDFFANDATRYAQFLMGKTYCFRLNSDPSKLVCALTLSNDSIRIYDLPRSRRDHMRKLTHHEKPLRRYPGVLIGRLGAGRYSFCRIRALSSLEACGATWWTSSRIQRAHCSSRP